MQVYEGLVWVFFFFLKYDALIQEKLRIRWMTANASRSQAASLCIRWKWLVPYSFMPVSIWLRNRISRMTLVILSKVFFMAGSFELDAVRQKVPRPPLDKVGGECIMGRQKGNSKGLCQCFRVVRDF